MRGIEKLLGSLNNKEKILMQAVCLPYTCYFIINMVFMLFIEGRFHIFTPGMALGFLFFGLLHSILVYFALESNSLDAEEKKLEYDNQSEE